MAQHLQNRLAREGFLFPASLIQTLSTFVRDYAGSAPEVSAAVLHLLVEEAAQRVARPEFSRVTRFHGFCNSLAHTIGEFASAGCDSTRLAECLPEAPLGDAFLAVPSLEQFETGVREQIAKDTPIVFGVFDH